MNRDRLNPIYAQMGVTVFESLDRQMLPTRFAGMFAAAAAAGGDGPKNQTNVNVSLVNPVTRDPLKQMRAEAERMATGLWGDE